MTPKNLTLSRLMAFIVLLFISACESEENSIVPKEETLSNSQVALQPEKTNYVVKDGTLMFKDLETVLATQQFTLTSSNEILDAWEESIGFKSFRKVYEENEEAEDISIALMGYYGIINPEGIMFINDVRHQYDNEKLTAEFIGDKSNIQGRFSQSREITYYADAFSKVSNQKLEQSSGRTTIANCTGTVGRYRVITTATQGVDVYEQGPGYPTLYSEFIRVKVDNQRRKRNGRWKGDRSRWIRLNADYSVNYTVEGVNRVLTDNDFYERTPSKKKSHLFTLFNGSALSSQLLQRRAIITSVSGSIRGRGTTDSTSECTAFF